MCKQRIRGIRFKRHIEKHWVRGGGRPCKQCEEFDDFVRRIFGSKMKIPLKLLDP